MEEIRKQSGQTPAILSCDWGSGWAENDKPELLIDYACNSALIDHWKKGGLVAISAHLPNPTFAKGGGLKEPRDGNFPDLSNFNTDAGRRWKTFLDRFVAGLRELQQAGVTVLFRPLHEMNGDWFFWGDRVSRNPSLWLMRTVRFVQSRIRKHTRRCGDICSTTSQTSTVSTISFGCIRLIRAAVNELTSIQETIMLISSHSTLIR